MRVFPAGFVPPCLPTKAQQPPSGPLWWHGIKHDGFRVIARKDGARVRLYSRPGNDAADGRADDRMSSRREFITLLGGAAAVWPLAAGGQQPAKVASIGYLGLASASWHTPRVNAFRAGLRALGYTEGKDIVIEFRWAEGRYDKLPALAAELVRLNVDVIVTHTVPGAIAAKQATSTIPIVITAASDLLAFGLVESLARPGGNLTGSSFFNAELVAKRLELLKELAPSLSGTKQTNRHDRYLSPLRVQTGRA
jgi:putative ABC transport system substrate-binding protein